MLLKKHKKDGDMASTRMFVFSLLKQSSTLQTIYSIWEMEKSYTLVKVHVSQ